MIYLYEYSNQIYWGTDQEVNHLLDFLEEIWKKRQSTPFAWQQYFQLHAPKEENRPSNYTQQFLHINRQNHIQANNYVGTIRLGNRTIHLLPKIFKQKNNSSPTPPILNLVHQHIMRWLAYSTKMHFPLIEGQYKSSQKNDIAEILIFTFAHYVHQLLQKQTFMDYEAVQKNTSYIKGRLNTTKYVSKHLAMGKWQEIPSEFNQFGLDNTFNRILKHTILKLLSISQNIHSQEILQQNLQFLTTVSLQNYESSDCDKVELHPLFEEWQWVLNYCKLFLASSAQFAAHGNTKALAFLIPMEQLFEQFVFGFLQKHFPHWQPRFQDNSTFLALDEAQSPAFQLQYDITLNIGGELVILDCKYKKIQFKKGKVKGVDAQDLYQIAAYAMRRACKRVFLIYPNIFQGIAAPPIQTVKTSTYFDLPFPDSKQNIRVWILQIPLIDSSNMQNWQAHLQSVFEKALV